MASHIYTSVFLRLLWEGLLFFSEALGSGQMYALYLLLKQITQGLIYLGKHRDPRKTANHLPGESENLKGDNYPRLPAFPVNDTELEPPGEVWSFPGGTVVRNLPANAGDTRNTGSIPGLGRSPGEGNGNPLQYSCLENPHGQRSLVGCSPWGCKESDMTEHASPPITRCCGPAVVWARDFWICFCSSYSRGAGAGDLLTVYTWRTGLHGFPWPTPTPNTRPSREKVTQAASIGIGGSHAQTPPHAVLPIAFSAAAGQQLHLSCGYLVFRLPPPPAFLPGFLPLIRSRISTASGVDTSQAVRVQ